MPTTSLARSLEGHDRIGSLGDWDIRHIPFGKTSPCTVRMRREQEDLFVKQVKENERYALRLLSELNLRIQPSVLLPELLERNLLVTRYVPGGHLRGDRLSGDFLKRYAEMQEALGRPEITARRHPFHLCEQNDRDDGTYRYGLLWSIPECFRRLEELHAHGLPGIDPYLSLARVLERDAERAAERFAGMPFGWLHSDFRDENLVGSPLRLIDWGSSCGYGPFLYDLAPFLLSDPEGLRVFRQHSAPAREADQATLLEWLHAATAAHFWGFVLWQLPVGAEDLKSMEREERSGLERMLRDQYPVYVLLLEQAGRW